MSEWIPIKHCLPIQMPKNLPTMDWVLVCSTNEPFPITIARWDGDKWDFLSNDAGWDYGAVYGDCTHAMDRDDITHWMPLPKPPEE
jgi:hypothetical protein